MFFSRNFGHSQYGFTAGTEYANGDAVVWIDADLQDQPELIEEFIKKWREGYEVVYGVRTKRRGNLLMNIAYKVFYIIFRKSAFVDIPRDAGDFSLLDRKVVNVLNAMPERDRLVRGLRAWAGFKSIGVEYHRDARHMGQTSNNLIKSIWWAKKAIFSFSYAPIEIVFYTALAALGVSILAILFYIGSFIFGSGAPRGFTSLLLVVLFLGSAQLLSISIVAEYVSRTFEEVKRRPQYVVEEIINDRKNEKFPRTA
jgi:dolichol-phosphate mannosyltransferase